MMAPLTDERVREIVDMYSGPVAVSYQAAHSEIASLAHELLQARQTLALHDDVCAKLNARIDQLEEMNRDLVRELADRGVHR